MVSLASNGWIHALDRGSSEARPGAPEAEIGSQAAVDSSGGVRLVCARCLSAITDTSRSMSVRDAHEHALVNPAGILYRVRCFSSAPGCAEAGEFTVEYTWFAGFAWRYALCSSCGEHLGWAYRPVSGGSAAPGSFYGLIADKLLEHRAAEG